MAKCPSCGTENLKDNNFCSKCGYEIFAATGRLSPDTFLENRYIIVETIGRGGMGAVYKALDSRLKNIPVAIKEMSSSALGPGKLKEAVEAFEKEASMLISLRHLSLPRITDFFSQEGDRWYLVMDYIEGETLESIAKRRGAIPESEVLSWAKQLCEVLDYLHSQDPPVIFRDLKPSNIMLTPDNEIKLIDFGIARHFKPGMTTDTSYYGSAGFSPPEQYGEGQTDARSDIYGLGATLHYLLTGIDPGRKPFQFEPPSDTVTISPEIEKAIMQAVEFKKEKRPTSAKEFRQMLPEQAEAPTGAPKTEAAKEPQYRKEETMKMPVSRNSQNKSKSFIWIAAAAVFFLLLISIGFGAGFFGDDYDNEVADMTKNKVDGDNGEKGDLRYENNINEKVKFDEYFNERFGFTIKHPNDWVGEYPQNNDGATFYHPDNEDIFISANGSLASTSLEKGFSVYFASILENLESSGYEITQTKDFTHNIEKGDEIYKMPGKRYSYIDNDDNIVMAYYGKFESINYRIRCVAPANEHNEYKELFSYIIETFQVNEALDGLITHEEKVRVVRGKGYGYNPQTPIEVDVKMVGNEIKEIIVIEHDETQGISDPAFEEIPDRIVTAQNLNVDVVSGATDTSEGIMKAVANATDFKYIEEKQPKLEGKSNIIDSITGIDPWTGIMAATEEAMEVYDLHVGLIEGSDAAMTAELGSAIANEEWIVVTGWAPHWKFAEWDLKFLEDPDLVYGGEEYIANIARLGLADDHPEVHELLQNFSWGDEDIGAVMAMNRDDNDFLGNAQAWIEDKRDMVDGWIPEDLEGNGEEIEILMVGWECATASTYTMTAVLEEAGYDVTVTPLDVGVIWSSIAEGDADFFVCAWLPGTHEAYMNDFEDSVDEVAIQYEGAKIGLVVPAYMPIDYITEINDYAQ